jgi:hypothetical protein
LNLLGYLAAFVITGLWALFHENFEIKAWHVTVVAEICCVIYLFLNIYGRRLIPLIDSVSRKPASLQDFERDRLPFLTLNSKCIGCWPLSSSFPSLLFRQLLPVPTHNSSSLRLSTKLVKNSKRFLPIWLSKGSGIIVLQDTIPISSHSWSDVTYSPKLGPESTRSPILPRRSLTRLLSCQEP